MENDNLNFISLGQYESQYFYQFLEDLKKNKDHIFFHPHGFDKEDAENIINLSKNTKDEYWVLCENKNTVAYGMLRGWDEGYNIPSIGVAVSPKYRNQGLSKIMMNFLHKRAKERQVNKIRLKVSKNNLLAIYLYKKLGYDLQEYSENELLGVLSLT